MDFKDAILDGKQKILAFQDDDDVCICKECRQEVDATLICMKCYKEICLSCAHISGKILCSDCK